QRATSDPPEGSPSTTTHDRPGQRIASKPAVVVTPGDAFAEHNETITGHRAEVNGHGPRPRHSKSRRLGLRGPRATRTAASPPSPRATRWPTRSHSSTA